jgi:hypothetical protein
MHRRVPHQLDLFMRRWPVTIGEILFVGIATLWLWYHVPSAGYAAAGLAFVAFIVSLVGEMHWIHKVILVGLLAALTVIEFKAIEQDKAAFLQSQDQLFDALSGKMIPASDPTPKNACSQDKDAPLRTDEVLVIFGDCASVANNFPHTVLRVNDDRILSLHSDGKGNMALEVKSIAPDGKVVFQVDEDGVFIGRDADVHLFHPDKSTVLLKDAFGAVLLRARYINKQAFSVQGKIPYRGRIVPVQLPGLHDGCLAAGSAGSAGSADIQLKF